MIASWTTKLRAPIPRQRKWHNRFTTSIIYQGIYLQETRPDRVQKGSTAAGPCPQHYLSPSGVGRQQHDETWSCCRWCSLGETATPHLWFRIRSCPAKKQEALKPKHRDGSQTFQTGLRCLRPWRCWCPLLWEPVKTTGRRVTFQTKNVTKKIHSILQSFFLKVLCNSVGCFHFERLKNRKYVFKSPGSLIWWSTK